MVRTHHSLLWPKATAADIACIDASAAGGGGGGDGAAADAPLLLPPLHASAQNWSQVVVAVSDCLCPNSSTLYI